MPLPFHAGWPAVTVPRPDAIKPMIPLYAVPFQLPTAVPVTIRLLFVRSSCQPLVPTDKAAVLIT